MANQDPVQLLDGVQQLLHDVANGPGMPLKPHLQPSAAAELGQGPELLAAVAYAEQVYHVRVRGQLCQHVGFVQVVAGPMDV
mmetsp:Transcript_99059/g.275737  ORF Transcript_99059/g.275737 Transcript_99059/m.275737 type:complete len:82 (+) Transcript_99059:761-1006(+)